MEIKGKIILRYFKNSGFSSDVTLEMEASENIKINNTPYTIIASKSKTFSLGDDLKDVFEEIRGHVINDLELEIENMKYLIEQAKELELEITVVQF